jgi:IS5 family transposase
MSAFIDYGNPGLFDSFVQELDVATFDTPLARVGKIIDWSIFRAQLHEAVLSEPKGPGGRPRFEPLLMFKVLVLQRINGLADDQTSFQITDRCSFRLFLGLTPADDVPDGQTISDFKEDLVKANAFDGLFATFLSHLQVKHGLALAKQGVMIDATFAQVPRQRNSREENEQIKEGKVPESIAADPKRRAHKDTDARWTKKNEETFYGYKDHVKVDVEDKFILDAEVTSAEVHDSQPVERLIKDGDKVLFADSAYTGQPIEKVLEERNVKGEICEKGTRGHPLTEEQRTLNTCKSRIRSRVEHVFAQMRGSMKALYQRCIGFERNKAGLQLTNLVYNMMRFEQIKRLNLVLTGSPCT